MDRGVRIATVGGAVLVSVVAAVALHHFAPAPSADSARASESAFADGLEEREFVPPMMGPGRWTSGGASFRFRHLSPGPARLEVRVRNHQSAVRVSSDRVGLGLVAAGDRGADFQTTVYGHDLQVDLVVRPFLARGGRRLGTFLDRVTLVHARSFVPPQGLLALFAAPALAIALASLRSGMPPGAALATSAATSLTQALLLAPHGVVRSAMTEWTAGLLVAGAALFGAVSKGRPWLFIALLVSFIVQGLAATHPLVVGLDASFHAHNLAEVLGGNYFLESETQHEPPFRFPYGISFYLPLVLPAREGFGLIGTVRVAAAIAGILGSIAVFRLVARRSPRQAAAAVVLLQFLPWTFVVYSNGNYSNVFAQTTVILFFVWWTSGKPFGWPAGAAAFAVGALAHLSGFLFLIGLGAALVFVHRRDLQKERAGLIALGVGLGCALLYYSHFVSLVLGELPRLAESGRGGTGAATALESLGVQFFGALQGWGIPAAVLALAGLPWGGDRLDRDLRAVWLAGAALALAAVATPVEVRYLYALTFPLAVAAATGSGRLWKGGVLSKLSAAALVTAQIALGARTIVQAMLYDWRA
jgi:hypothetical protein